EIPMPLKNTDVHASVSGFVGSVEVSQQFYNPYSSKIEAVYVFPLPHNAAVNEFIMTIGDRKIRGIIRERKEAEQIYQQAKRQGSPVRTPRCSILAEANAPHMTSDSRLMSTLACLSRSSLARHTTSFRISRHRST